MEDHLNNEKLTPFVRRFVRSWKQKIGLHGWTITWTWATQAAVDTVAGYHAAACTSYDYSKQEATIRINRDLEWQIKDRYVLHYLQETLLHELVHIRVAGGEVMLGNLGAVFDVYLPDSANHAAHEAQIGVREFYADAIVALLLNQEERHGDC